MATICQQCGDKGFSSALVYCVKCLDWAVHRYCLDELPATFDEFVRWFCEDCKPKVAKQYPLEKPGSVPSGKRDHVSLKGVQVTHSKIKLKKNEVARLGDCSPLKIKLKHSTCSVAVTEEQRHQSSLSQQPLELHTKLNLTKRAQLGGDCSPLKVLLKKKKGVSRLVAGTEERRHQINSSQQPCEAHTKLDLTERAQLVGDCSPLKIKLKKKKGITRSVAETKEQRHQSSSSQQPREAHTKLDLTECAQLAGDCFPLKIKLKRKKEDVTPSEAGTEEQKRQSSSSQHTYGAHTKLDLTELFLWMGDCPSLNENRSDSRSSEDHGNDLKLEKQRSLILEDGSRFGEEVVSVRLDASQTAPLDLTNILHAEPIIDPIWRGSFNICNKQCGMFDGVVAHLSIKACPKVYEEASLLPALLCSELLPKSDVWPKSFEILEPSDNNIALYFFPEKKRYESVFYRLVDDMMRQELAMRAIVKNAELLVFTSTELPLLYWKFHGKYYLWGVFRGNQASSSSHPTNHHLMVRNRNHECVVHSNSANDVGAGEERSLVKTKTWDARSPLSPLSDNGEHEHDMELESEDLILGKHVSMNGTMNRNLKIDHPDKKT